MKQRPVKLLCALLCFCSLLCLTPVALAETKTGYIKAGTAISANICKADVCGWQIIGAFSAAGEVTVLSEQDDYYFVSAQGRQGFVAKSDVSFTAPAATASTATAAATTKKSTSTAKKIAYCHVVNCKEWVNINRTADKDALGKVYKNDLLILLGTSGEYTKVTTMKNTTGYVKSDYIESGLLTKGDEVVSDPYKVKSTQNNIWLRCTPDKSTSASNIQKKLSGMKDKEFLVVAENDGWYLLKYEDCTGYGRSEDFIKAK